MGLRCFQSLLGCLVRHIPMVLNPFSPLPWRPWCLTGLLALAAVWPLSVQAARPMNTDDANVVDPKGCQLETWVRRTRSSTEQWAVPGCNFWGDVEWSLGGQQRSDDTPWTSGLLLGQAKKRWLRLSDGDWGVSTTLGFINTQPTSDFNATQRDVYFNAPITRALGQDRFVHLNLGWVQHNRDGSSRPTWGLGGEWPLSPRLIAISEVYAESTTPSQYQVGLRFWVKPQRVQIDTTYGNVMGSASDQQWISIGLRLLTPAFLP
jgi:hypothetical protein